MHTITTVDAELARAVRRTSVMRQAFYAVVLLVALAGQVSGAVEALGMPVLFAILAVGALELGAMVVLANADVRRRLGERATAGRVLSALIAAGAVAFQFVAHADRLHGSFYAGMSALGYLVWLMHTENARRDRLRATGDLPPTTPAYELYAHWTLHPLLTLRAKGIAKANPGLGLYGSLDAARAEIRRDRRIAAIGTVLARKIRATLDPAHAEIALATYDMDEIATRVADGADYDGLAALLNAELAPAVIAGGKLPKQRTPRNRPTAPAPVTEPAAIAAEPVVIPEPVIEVEAPATRRRGDRTRARVRAAWANRNGRSVDELAAHLEITPRHFRRVLAQVETA